MECCKAAMRKAQAEREEALRTGGIAGDAAPSTDASGGVADLEEPLPTCVAACARMDPPSTGSTPRLGTGKPSLDCGDCSTKLQEDGEVAGISAKLLEALLDKRHTKGEVALCQRLDTMESALQEICLMLRSGTSVGPSLPTLLDEPAPGAQ